MDGERRGEEPAEHGGQRSEDARVFGGFILGQIWGLHEGNGGVLERRKGSFQAQGLQWD